MLTKNEQLLPHEKQLETQNEMQTLLVQLLQMLTLQLHALIPVYGYHDQHDDDDLLFDSLYIYIKHLI